MLARPSKKEDIKISRVTNLSESLMKDCYYVISQSLPSLANDFYYFAQRDVKRDNHVLFIAETPVMVVGVLNGMVFDMPDGAYAKIDCFCVDKHYRCRGIGKQLLDAYENYVVGVRGATCIGLQASSSASRFYRNNGFVGKVYMKKTLTR